MSLATPRVETATTAITPTIREGLRRRRSWIVIGAVLLAGAIVMLVAQGGLRAPGPTLGPANAAPAGAKALVEVLRQHGVTVTEVRSADDAVEGARAGATVLLYDEFDVLDEDRLAHLAAEADRLVVAEPSFRSLDALAPGVRLAGAASGAIDDVACHVRAARQAGGLSDGQRLLTVDADAAAEGWQGCFRDGEYGYAMVTGAGASGGEITLVGATSVFTNERIAESGNAALAIGLLGASGELVWYLPGPADADPSQAPNIAELTPGWVSPVLVLGIAVVIATGVWRGRRFGPLVAERLPVTVPAGETSEGRARLYARGAARGHALDQLRIAAIGRIAATLRLPRSAPVDAVADAAATATGRDAAPIARLLVGSQPTGDRDLIDLAAELARLEDAVSASVRPDPDPDPDHHHPTGRRP
jgi:hypothetical protein